MVGNWPGGELSRYDPIPSLAKWQMCFPLPGTQPQLPLSQKSGGSSGEAIMYMERMDEETLDNANRNELL